MGKLTEKEIEFFKGKLEELKRQLSQTLRDVSEDVKSEEPKGYSQHQADEGTDDFGRTISIGLTSNEMDILKQVNRALEKIEEGTYGICDLTGDEIPKRRLEAVPYATMTVQAQEKWEKGLL
ncbi:MAG: TraR/DksA family transcriptional regulator [Simkaniaceae bacterium]